MADRTWASNVHSFYGTRDETGSTSTASSGSSAGSMEDRFSAASSGQSSYGANGEGRFEGTSSIATSGSNYDTSQPNDRMPTNTTGLTPDSVPID